VPGFPWVNSIMNPNHSADQSDHSGGSHSHRQHHRSVTAGEEGGGGDIGVGADALGVGAPGFGEGGLDEGGEGPAVVRGDAAADPPPFSPGGRAWGDLRPLNSEG